MARAHVTKTSEDEWLPEYEVAADAFRKANGDLLRELVQGGMDAGEFRRRCLPGREDGRRDVVEYPCW